jgi:negative regulator of flagellin synthesis FlgM
MNVDRTVYLPRLPSSSLENLQETTAAGRGARMRPSEAAVPAPPGGTVVDLSDQARALAQAYQAVKAAPDVRADKVAALAAQIAAGTYHVAPEAVAQKLLGGKTQA